MEAIKFIKERNRMCATHKGGCAWCPANGDNCSVGLKSDLSADEQVKIVEEWAAAHPRKTRQSEFLKQWPEAYVCGGVLMLCPMFLCKKYVDEQEDFCIYHDDSKMYCDKCRREFWGQEVE
jgi:hypothetical protein